MSSRLFQEVREKRGLCYTIHAFHMPYSDTGLFALYAGTDEADAPELMRVVIDEIAGATETLNETEVARAKAQMRAGPLMALESSEARIGQLARQMLAYGRPIPLDEIVAKVDAVTVESARAAGRMLIGRSRRRSPRSAPAPALKAPRRSRKVWCAGRPDRNEAHRPASVHGVFPHRQSERESAGHCRRRRHVCACRRSATIRLGGAARESRAFLTPWEPTWPADDLTRGAFRRRLKRYAEDLRSDLAYAFLIFRSDDNAMVGGLTLANIRRGVAQAGSIGYWVGAPFARQGYMTAAMRALVPFCFGTLRLHRLEAACIPDQCRLDPPAGKDRIPARRLCPRLFLHQRPLAGPPALCPPAGRSGLRPLCLGLAMLGLL